MGTPRRTSRRRMQSVNGELVDTSTGESFGPTSGEPGQGGPGFDSGPYRRFKPPHLPGGTPSGPQPQGTPHPGTPHPGAPGPGPAPGAQAPYGSGPHPPHSSVPPAGPRPAGPPQPDGPRTGETGDAGRTP